MNFTEICCTFQFALCTCTFSSERLQTPMGSTQNASRTGPDRREAIFGGDRFQNHSTQAILYRILYMVHPFTSPTPT